MHDEYVHVYLHHQWIRVGKFFDRIWRINRTIVLSGTRTVSFFAGVKIRHISIRQVVINTLFNGRSFSQSGILMSVWKVAGWLCYHQKCFNDPVFLESNTSNVFHGNRWSAQRSLPKLEVACYWWKSQRQAAYLQPVNWLGVFYLPSLYFRCCVLIIAFF